MKHLLLTLGLFGFLAAGTRAAETFSFTTRDGLELKSVKFSRRTPDGVSFVTADGVRKIAFENLPADLQQRFGFDPAETGTYRARRRAAEAEKRAGEREAELARRATAARKALLPPLDTTVRGTVERALPNGVYLSGASATRPGKTTEIRQIQTGGPTTLSPKRPPTFRSVVVEVEREIPIDLGGDSVFLESRALAKRALEGQRILVLAYRIGRIQRDGETLARFTTDEEVAIAHAEAERARARSKRTEKRLSPAR